MAGTGLEPIFPCWLIPTDGLAREMIAAGVRAHLVCVDPRKMERKFAGRVFDAELLAELAETVDPCGERGEFHTFVSAGPMFSRSIEVSAGEIVERDGFVYADLLPA
jgi:diphthamide synthase (EF-2-diphthine--ammonia ligase)